MKFQIKKDIVGADFVREIEPGEMVIVTERGVQSMRPFEKAENRTLWLTGSLDFRTRGCSWTIAVTYGMNF